ncbi:MAG: hypothetical protein A2808_02710 [Candidatus Moranbacteria bacterium RIFCSPHIGHO2_01_FULL_55_24]|nr:MAG: hypothetical protein A2808_02710 [Candidatus Moranbacteria bacterium RIFCSPHIGHO2_01_FULL_55_24]
MSLYQDHILDHYHNPRNYGNLPHATHHAEALNPTCGDSLALDLNIEDGIIKEVGFTGKGCAISLASASLLFEEAKGKETVKMQVLAPEDVLKLTGLALSPVRMKCALLSLETLKKALKSK